MSVLSFAADTDWYITPQLIARKLYVDDVDKIYQFYDQYCNTHSAKFNIFNDVLSGAEDLSQDYIKSYVDKSDCVIGLIDDENTVGILWVKSVNNLAIEVYCQVLDSIVSEDSLVDVLKLTFPMGSMTGAPKISVMKIIEELEETKRGLYSGAIGYISPNGDFDFNVVIRSILYNQEKKYVSFSVGSAITSLSNPEKEYEECLLKAKAMHEVLC
mgnify:CR=1 FL=1